MPREFPGYHDIDERLAGFRTEILTRMRRLDELDQLPRTDRVNLAAAEGAVVRVDSFLGTINTDRIEDVYFPVDESGPRPAGIPFAIDDADHPVLRELRERFDLEQVAGTGTDLEKAVRVRDWTKSLFPHFIPFRMPDWNALIILDRASRGVENFICIHYSVAFVQCCLALGMPARMINLHRGMAEGYRIGDEAIADPPVDEHVVAEVWCAELGKWVMQDTDFDCHYERGGTALSARDIHDAFGKGELEQLTCRRGPGSKAFTALADEIEAEDAFFGAELPAYYAHVSVLMRADFLTDPTGPVPVAHVTDPDTAPILWHGGSDNRLQPHLMGPVVVATPYTDRVRLLTDGNETTAWASADTAGDHWVEIELAEAASVGRIGLVWPEHAGTYRTSRRLRIEAVTDGADGTDGTQVLAEVTIDPEGPVSVFDFDVVTTNRIRVVQPSGGGAAAHPDRLWLAQVDVLAPAAPAEVPA